ncbi:MAG: hypothetical protein NTX03_00100 [Bacteroidetes bacterium]|nr:hypothetical protein [Bacteroidota bacterium]
MKSIGVKIIIAILVLVFVGSFLYQKSKDSDSIISEWSQKLFGGNAIKDTLVKTNNDRNIYTAADYEIVPREEFNERDTLTQKVFSELKERYKKYFKDLVGAIKSDGAKPVLCFVTTEAGASETNVQRQGKSLILNLCKENDVDFFDFTPEIAALDPKVYSFMPVDGHFNKYGARLVSNFIEKILEKYPKFTSPKTFKEEERPKIFGDFEPNQNVILDGGKNLPYKLKTNAQGVRMNYDIKFPKKKQRILIIGDSEFYFPFLDNDNTAFGILQNKYKGKEFMNTASWGFSVDDYLSLWNEKARFSEPDLVLIASTGDDISDQFFSQRLRGCRHKNNIKPTELEKRFYEKLKAKDN